MLRYLKSLHMKNPQKVCDQVGVWQRSKLFGIPGFEFQLHYPFSFLANVHFGKQQVAAISLPLSVLSTFFYYWKRRTRQNLSFANRWNQGNFKYMEINKILFHLNKLYYLKDSDREILCPLDHLSPIPRIPMTVKPKPGAWKLMCLPINVPPPRVCTRRKLALEA